MTKVVQSHPVYGIKLFCETVCFSLSRMRILARHPGGGGGGGGGGGVILGCYTGKTT